MVSPKLPTPDEREKLRAVADAAREYRRRIKALAPGIAVQVGDREQLTPIKEAARVLDAALKWIVPEADFPETYSASYGPGNAASDLRKAERLILHAMVRVAYREGWQTSRSLLLEAAGKVFTVAEALERG